MFCVGAVDTGELCFSKFRVFLVVLGLAQLVQLLV